MNTYKALLAIFGLLFIASAPCMAENHVVTVGGGSSGGGYNDYPTLSFEPAQLSINAGDTVTFQNAGGVHNVHSDTGAITQFHCSIDCTANNAPDGASWSATVTFPTAGTIGYHCDQHVNMGMHGTITVKQVAPPPFSIGGYISGNWYVAGQGGHGFQIEAATNNNMIAIWFVYAPDGSAQNWIYAQGNYVTNSNTVTLPAVLFTGAAFPPNFVSSDLTQTTWGTLSFTFTDCNTGSVSWNSTDSSYSSGSSPITRLTQIEGTSCPQ